MPGFFVTNTEKVPILKNYDDSRCTKGNLTFGKWQISWNVLNKYNDDKVFLDNEKYIVLLDGVILNKKSLMKELGMDSWETTMVVLADSDTNFFERLRGSFAGAIYEKRTDTWLCFADQVGNHLMMTYADNNGVAFGCQLNYFTDWMKLNGINREISSRWLNDMFSYGYMLDVHTIIEGVTRLFPGDYAVIKEGKVNEQRYYRVKKETMQRSENEWIELLDQAFTTSIQRILEKCEEYGYKSAIDLSGGLDSRMIALIANKCIDDINQRCIGINYSQRGSADDVIARDIAEKLGLNSIFYMMDGGECLKEIDDFVFMNQGFNFYAGITGGKKVLETLDRSTYGMELWGILGDIYEGAMIVEKDVKKPDWCYPRFATSSKFENNNKEGYRDYPDNELLWFYVRGMLCGQNTAFIRQNYLEAVPPYGDVEFMNLIFSISYETRTDGHIYRKWMIRKYKELSKIKYSHSGVRVTETDEEEKKLRLPVRIKNKIRRTFLWEKYEKFSSMNPMDYWLHTNDSLKIYFNEYYKCNEYILEAYPVIKDKVKKLYDNGNGGALDIIIALTAMSAVKQYID